MRERPILFSAPMVRAILEGRKTQTRRVVKLPHANPLGIWEPTTTGGKDARGVEHAEQVAVWHTRTGHTIGHTYGQPGDRLWVRETWGLHQHQFDHECRDVVYRADEQRPAVDRWRPSIHMPRWASRIDLEVTGVRVERLQDISEADAMAEGIERVGDRFKGYAPLHTGMSYDPATAKTSFSQLWESINGAGSWTANPLVWVVEFKRGERK